jgi:hypothetical protein
MRMLIKLREMTKQDIGNSKKVDAINILLIFISLVVAVKVPFELFLFSYAVLGPLHYLTEINWLNEKSYFVKDRRWVWILVLISCAMTVPLLFKMPAFSGINSYKIGRGINHYGSDIFYGLTFVSFLFAISLVYLNKWQHILISLIANILLVFIIARFNLFSLAVLTMFVPTVVHVFFFTLLFMIYGSIKTGNMAGVASSILLFISPFIIYSLHIEPSSYVISKDLQETFFKSDFQDVDAHIAQVLNALERNGSFAMHSEAGIKIQIFIAFAYTYHYLNWFSKTTVIGWHKYLTRKKSILIGSVWLVSAGLYWYDYRVGFASLFLLSLIHVLCEFPLNIISIKGSIAAFLPRKKLA